MREISFDERQKIHFESMLFIREICEKYNLTYFLAYGTLLGSVRHKGFIPWDDDVDFLMPADDYEKLISISKEVETDDWEIITYKNNPNYLQPTIKVCNKHTKVYPSRFFTGLIYGVSTDIFPLYYVYAKDDIEMKSIVEHFYVTYKQTMHIVRPLVALQPGMKTTIRNVIARPYYNLIGQKRISLIDTFLSMEDEARTLGTENCNYVFNLFQRKLPITFWKKEMFFPQKVKTLSTAIFQGEYFTIPYDYDAILKQKYGDYMALPDESKRVPPHYVKAYYID